MANPEPTICPCRCACDFLSKLDKNIYDIENPDTFLAAFFDVVCMEFCDINVSVQKAKNDFYLWKDIDEEAVIKGEPYGVDCFKCKTVVEILSIGDTPGASDYIQGIDFEVDECGVKWLEPSSYYTPYYYGYSQGQTGPFTVEAKQPETGSTYYVNYRCGVRNDKLYENFGILVGLIKKDYQTYEDYRHAIKSLIIAFLKGPTKESLIEALSILISKENIEIIEGFDTGWILGESYLYTKSDFDNPLIDTTDGTILKAGQDFIFDIFVHNSYLVQDKQLFLEIVDKIKPAHTIATTHFL